MTDPTELWPDRLGGAGTSAARHDPPPVEPRHPDPLAELLGPVHRAAPTTWQTGAAGERRTAAHLSPLTQAGWRLLHDRRLPGTHANLDHLAIGPPGVTLIDTKQYRGRIKILGGRLWYGKHDLQDVLDLLAWEADHVTAILGIDVRRVLCIHGARLPQPAFTWHHTLITNGPALRPTLTSLPARLDPLAIIDLADRAERLLPPASTTP